MSEILTEREKFIVKAGMQCAHAMADYARAGYDDYEEVGAKLSECMGQITDKLDLEGQLAFARWLVRKTEETNEEIRQMEEGLTD